MIQMKPTDVRATTSGQSLILVLLLLSLAASLLAVFLCYLAAHLHFAARTIGGAAARSLAESGVEYALHQLKYGDWLAKEKPLRFKSPEIGGTGVFELLIEEVDGGSTLKIQALGRDSFSGVKKTVTVTVANPMALTGFLLSVLNLDYELEELQRSPVSVFGSDGVAATGVIQELHTIPTYSTVSLLASTDPLFAGVLQGSDYVTDDSGVPLSRTDKLPPGPGKYSIDYATGIVQFSASDAGRPVCIIYDYLRRIPPPPGPHLVSLPYVPIREGSDTVPAMLRIADSPSGKKGVYQPDYRAGVLRFSEQDGGAIISPRYSYLGTRMTGAVRVNGNVELQNTNLFYLFGSKRQQFSASGRISYGPLCNLTIWDESGPSANARPQSEGNGLLVERAAEFRMPPIDTDRLRRRAKLEREGGVYFDNRSDVEFEDLRPEDASTNSGEIRSEREELDWEAYMKRLYHDWSVSGSDNWRGGVYSPPGVTVDLSSVPQVGQRMIFAEGNILLKGTLAEDQQLIVVSCQNIYIEDNIGRSPSSSLTLIAEGNVCVNLSKLQPQLSAGRPLTLYMNCIVFARRGTLGVIPGGTANNRAIMHGAFFVNRLYPNEQWAKAFASIDWIYDPSFSNPPKLPAGLLIIRSWEE